jgi:hypothetical protein
MQTKCLLTDLFNLLIIIYVSCIDCLHTTEQPLKQLSNSSTPIWGNICNKHGRHTWHFNIHITWYLHQTQFWPPDPNTMYLFFMGVHASIGMCIRRLHHHHSLKISPFSFLTHLQQVRFQAWIHRLIFISSS